jgi:hypothetical protein
MLLTKAENDLLRKLDFDPAIGDILRKQTSAPLSRWLIWEEEAEPQCGLSIAVDNGDQAEKLMDVVQPQLKALGYKAFWGHRKDERGIKETDEVVVLHTTDPDEIVRLCHTGGENYGVSNRDILARLDAWRKLCEFDVVGAARDWVALQFSRLPERMAEFAVEVYKFCPDTVDQGTGLSRERNFPADFAEARDMFPTIPFEAPENDMPARPAGIPQELWEQATRLRASLKADSTSTAMGIRLLARALVRTKYIFLWWD